MLLASDSGFTLKFIHALSLIAAAIEDVAAQGSPCPVLVGGAAVALWTSVQYMTGDWVVSQFETDCCSCFPLGRIRERGRETPPPHVT